MNPLILFLKAEWKPLLILAILVSVLGYIQWLKHDITSLETKLATSTVSIANLQSGINTQNTAVLALGKKEKEAEAKLAALIDAQKKLNKTHQDDLAKMKAKPTPKNCEEALGYLKDRSDLTW